MDKRYKKAFTLVELLVVVSIIGILSSIAAINMGSSRVKAKLAASQSFESSIVNAVGSEMVGEWLFDEASGTAARDTSGNGRDGTVVGATRVAGISGNALSFSSNNYVSLGTDAALNPPNFTISVWIKSGNVSGSYNYIYSNARDCCGSYNGINLVIDHNGLYGVIWNTGAYYVGPVSFPNGSDWTHVAFSYNGSKMMLYMNGRMVASGNYSLGVGQPASFGNYIGALSNCPGGCNNDGTAIDQVRLYGNAIVAANIEKIYLAERGKYLAKK